MVVVSGDESESELDISVSNFEADGPQTLSVSRRRCTSVAVEHEQDKKAKASRERSPPKAVPDSVRNKSTPQNAPYKVVLSVRNRTPPPPEGTPVQERPTWLGPQSASPPGVEEEDLQRRKDGIDANRPWNARE